MTAISAQQIRRIVLEQSKRAHVGHIGCALSIADIVAALLGALHRSAADLQDRDRLVLSKGHAALALYAGLHLAGELSREQLDSFCQDGSALGVHPERNPTLGIDFSTGSLGQGLSMAASAAGRLVAPDLLCGQRRRVQRRCALGGGDVRRPPSAR
jgi:transketolase